MSLLQKFSIYFSARLFQEKKNILFPQHNIFYRFSGKLSSFCYVNLNIKLEKPSVGKLFLLCYNDFLESYYGNFYNKLIYLIVTHKSASFSPYFFMKPFKTMICNSFLPIIRLTFLQFFSNLQLVLLINN